MGKNIRIFHIEIIYLIVGNITAVIADRCEINRQIRADNKMLQELKAKVAKLAEAVEKSIPIIAETLEAIRNHMIFIQYWIEMIHPVMDHFFLQIRESPNSQLSMKATLPRIWKRKA